MASLYKPRYPYLNGSIALVAAIIERARLDVGIHSEGHRRCEATYLDHKNKTCAREFLDHIGNYMSANADADHIEIALEVLRYGND